MFWISKNSTYYDKGKKAYGCGDEIPDEVLESMGKETLDEYVEKGLIGDSVASVEGEEETIREDPEDPEMVAERERLAMLERAKAYGLKTHPKTGIVKLYKMVKDFEMLQALKREALELGIDPSDDVGFAKLKALVEEKKQAKAEDLENLQDLKKDALELGIDPSDDVTFEELTILVNEKIEADESDS